MSVLKTTAGAAAHLSRGFSYSFLLQLTAAVRKLKPSAVIVCWEGGFGGREKIYADYKGGRTDSSDTVKSQREELQRLLPHLGVEQAWCPGYEADDVIASLANTLPTPVIIFSNDKDFLQLVSDRVRVYQRPRVAGNKNRELIGPQSFESATGYRTPALFAKGQFALGDGVDGIPKVEGATPAKVHAYLHDMVLTTKMQERMEAVFQHPDYRRNAQLMDLRAVRELKEPLRVTYGKLSAEGAVNMLLEIGFASIVAKFDDWFAVYEGASHADVSD
jgi:DNA polymerase-1